MKRHELTDREGRINWRSNVPAAKRRLMLGVGQRVQDVHCATVSQRDNRRLRMGLRWEHGVARGK